MTESQTPTVAPVVHLEIEGVREGQQVFVKAGNIITEAGKIDRNSIFRAARLTRQPSFFRLFENGDVVAEGLRGAEAWSLTLQEGDPIEVEASESKRPGKAGKQGKMDAGPDAYKVVTQAIRAFHPELAVQSTGASRKKLSELRAQNEKLITALKLAGMSDEDIEALLNESEGEDLEEDEEENEDLEEAEAE
jgi:hypothetical protein